MLEALRPLEGGESFEGGRAPGGQSRWSAGKETAWVALEPVLVCEVTIDRMQYGRFRHAASFVRWRDDREPALVHVRAAPGAEPPAWPEAGLPRPFSQPVLAAASGSQGQALFALEGFTRPVRRRP